MAFYGYQAYGPGKRKMFKQNSKRQEISQIELMMFGLKSHHNYGINVLKIREIVHCPKLNKPPGMNKNVIGIANVRDKSIPVIDLSLSIGLGKTEENDSNFIIITEINNATQAFLVTRISKIVRMEWENVKQMPQHAGNTHYLTGVAQKDEDIISIIDVEKVLSSIYPVNSNVSNELKTLVKDKEAKLSKGNRYIMIVDDSNIARKQVAKTVLDLGLMIIVVSNGQEAIEKLLQMSKTGPIEESIAMVVSDIEMPVKDGYTLTAEIKNNPLLKNLYVVLHTSLSGVFNESLVKAVGADDFVSKFDAELLGMSIEKGLK